MCTMRVSEPFLGLGTADTHFLYYKLKKQIMRRKSFLLALLLLLVGVVNVNAEIGDALDRSGWTVTVSSSCDDGSGGHAQHLFDGNHGTYWHSNWGGGNATGGGSGNNFSEIPEYFIIDLGEVKSIGGFGYQGRNNDGVVNQSNMNGGLKDYKIFVSSEAFTVAAPATNDEKKAALDLTGEVVSGTLEWIGTEQKVATASEVQGRYILVLYVSSYGPQNGFANCDEFYVYGYSEDAKPTLIEKNTAFQAAVTAAESIVGTDPGYYKQTTIDAAKAAVAAAQTVIDNEASTDAEEAAAVETLEAAVAAFTANPIVAGIYKIICGYPEYYNQQGAEKAIYASSDAGYAWATLDENSKPYYWNVNVDDAGNVTIQNAAYGTWMNGMATLGETATTVTCTSLGSGQFNLNCGGVFHTGGHSNGAGVSGWITEWGGTANTASSWKLVAVDEIPEYAVNAWAWKDLDMAKPLYAGRRVSTLENGKQYLIYNTCMPSGQDRTGFIYSNGSGLSLDKTKPSELKLTRNSQVGFLWTVETTETEGVYRLKTYGGTYVESKYINIKGAHSATATTAQDIYITDFSATTPVEKANVGSRAQDEATTVANADISADDKVWAIYNNVSFSGNDQTWNGNTESFANWASAHPYAFYEVQEAKEVVLSSATNISGAMPEEVTHVATFSDVIDRVVPAGFTAYYAASKGEDNVLLEPIAAGEAIPANQGVVLAGNAAECELLPANKHAAPEGVESNVLGNSATGAVELVAGDYILATKGGVTAFYPLTVGGSLAQGKAYLTAVAGAAMMKLNFGGNTTAIEGVEAADADNAPVYDLSGRKVASPVKGGVYIKNGKKYIVK